jgi:DNA end-binding protein Ku
MYYPDEVRQPEQVDGKAKLRKPEVELAKSLVENLSAKFDPDKYDDTYRKELLALLRAKEAGKPLPEPEADDKGEVVDLMAALRESVEQTQKKKSGGRKRARKAS